MINTDLEQKIRTAVEHAAPDQLDSILSSCDEQKGVIDMTNTMTNNNEKTDRKKNHVKSRRTVFSAMAAVAAVFLLFVISFPTIRGTFFSPDYSVVMLDVNPSLSMNVDENEKVLSVEALNDDAKEILGSMDLKGTSLETAVNAIIGSMLQKGYLSDIQNSILVSVENKDANRSAQLQEQVLQIISQAVANSSMDAAVLSQTISDDNADLTELAEKYSISLGKAALIQEVVNQKPGTNFESLASMSINEIALIISSNHVSADSVTQTGTASDKAYIGEENARTKAYEHAGAAAGDVMKSEVKLDSEHGIMVYEVEFKTADMECEYEINACTGEVVDFEKEMINHLNQTVTGSEAETEAVKEPSGYENDDDHDDDRNDDHDSEHISDHHSLGSSGSSQPATDTYIGNEKALSIALEHAGLSTSDLTKKEIEPDDEDGRMIYKVELKTGKAEYEYEIDAVTGDILEAEIDEH
ncbi:MAG: PepSY domain-containing protein [Lachnospiraceae bacterium]